MQYQLSTYKATHLYGTLLNVAKEYCTQSIVVVQNNLFSSQKCNKIVEDLCRLGGIVEEAKRWPGTTLLDQTASVYKVPYTMDIVKYYMENNNSFLNWLAPDFPEDLCLLRSDNQPWLVTIAHEAICYLQVDEGDFNRLKVQIPDL